MKLYLRDLPRHVLIQGVADGVKMGFDWDELLDAALNPGDSYAVFDRKPTVRADSVCVNGHEWSEENTYLNPRGHRKCRACTRDRDRARRAETKETA